VGIYQLIQSLLDFKQMPISANPALLIVRFPVLIIKFWLIEGPSYLTKTTWSLIRTTAGILSISLLLKTFFAPWKGEYRKGYVAIARGIGMTIRFFTLITGILILVIEALLCLIVIVLWIGAPLYWVGLLLLSLGGLA